MGDSKGLTKERIVAEYLESDRSMREACEILGCCATTLIKTLNKYGLQAKPRSWNKRRKSRFPQLQDRAWLERQLEVRTMLDIAQELGTSSGNVSDHVKRYGLRWKHYDRIQAVRDGIRKAHPEGRRGEAASNWRGGINRVASGYIYRYKPEHPYANKRGYVMEHRLVVEEHLRRFLLPTEVVHHKNHVKDDNRIENLEVMGVRKHRVLHLTASERLQKLEGWLEKQGIQIPQDLEE